MQNPEEVFEHVYRLFGKWSVVIRCENGRFHVRLQAQGGGSEDPSPWGKAILASLIATIIYDAMTDGPMSRWARGLLV